MILATIRLMALTLMRDRAMLAMTFLLPPLVFLVFTTVFRDTASRAPIVEVAILDEAATPASRALATALAADDGLRVRPAAADLAALRSRVASGDVDAGVAIRPWPPVSGPETPPILVMTLPGRDLAGQIVSGRIERALGVALAAGGSEQPGGRPASEAVLRESVGSAGGDAVVAYHAGAIAVMFLMLASVQVAATLVEERESGIYERIASSGSVAGLVVGKFLFGVAQGTVQAGLILAAAVAVFGLDVVPTAPAIAITCVGAAALASSLTLAVAAACSTFYQAQTLCTFGVLALSALGGSMVPRLLMPPWLKTLGWATPNTWAIEAFQASFRSEAGSFAAASWHWAAMAGASALLLAGAVHAFSREPRW